MVWFVIAMGLCATDCYRQIYRWLQDAFLARAMLRLGQGRYDEAWQVLLAYHRLGRLVRHEYLACVTTDGVARVPRSVVARGGLVHGHPALPRVPGPG